MPAISTKQKITYVNRNNGGVTNTSHVNSITSATPTVRRCSQRKCNIKLATVSPSSVEDENIQETPGKKTQLKAKRSKRSLTAERERSNPINIKVLRRCHTQNVDNTTKNILPTIKKKS